MNGDILPYLLATIVIAGIGVGLLRLMGSGAKHRGLNQEWYQMQWRGIEQQFEDGAAGRALAVLNADKLLDKAMQDRGYKGQTMGERLKRHPGQFSDINAIWGAHKLRNKIAHENGFSVSPEEAQRALNQLKTGLKNLGAL